MEGLTEEFERIDFHHPFTPYNVQEQFMRTVYDVLERGDGQIGILESPTGTVSNSIPSTTTMICSSHKILGQIAFSHLRCHDLAPQSQEGRL